LSEQLVSIVLPVHGDADHLETVIASYFLTLEDLPVRLELVLVPNGCTTATFATCERLALDPRVRCVPASPGWGSAVKAGLAAASGDTIGYTTLARTHAHDLRLLVGVAAMNRNAVVKAVRRSRDRFGRRLGSVLYNFECRVLFRLATWDINGTPKLFPREILEQNQPHEDGDLIDLELMTRLRSANVLVLEVPIVEGTRHSGRSTTNLRSAVRMYAGAIHRRMLGGRW
jgi:glycosyltransferase involved in cell wall biosynthesis